RAQSDREKLILNRPFVEIHDRSVASVLSV
ncbi:MAG: hypothetical protein ACI9XB_000001, partial [Gammaproteobacteria bacterium]